MDNKLVVFRGKEIRRRWDDNQHSWSFSVVDVVAALTDSENPPVYWRVLKKRLKDEGADQTVTKCNAFKMPAADGKMRLTDMADTETMFRIIQSIPSPKAEPFKRWLAKVGYDRVQEIEDPELAKGWGQIVTPLAVSVGCAKFLFCTRSANGYDGPISN